MNDAAKRIFEKNLYAVLATVNQDGSPWVSIVHFACDEGHIYWLSSPEAQHSQNIVSNSKIAINIYDSHQTHNSPDEDKGAIYLTTKAKKLDGEEAITARNVYTERHGVNEAEKKAAWSVYGAPLGKIVESKTRGPLIYLAYNERRTE